MEGGGVGVAVCLHMEDLDHDDDEVLQPLEEEEDLAAGGKVKQLLSSRASKGRRRRQRRTNTNSLTRNRGEDLVVRHSSSSRSLHYTSSE